MYKSKSYVFSSLTQFLLYVFFRSVYYDPFLAAAAASDPMRLQVSTNLEYERRVLQNKSVLQAAALAAKPVQDVSNAVSSANAQPSLYNVSLEAYFFFLFCPALLSYSVTF